MVWHASFVCQLRSREGRKWVGIEETAGECGFGLGKENNGRFHCSRSTSIGAAVTYPNGTYESGLAPGPTSRSFYSDRPQARASHLSGMDTPPQPLLPCLPTVAAPARRRRRAGRRARVLRHHVHCAATVEHRDRALALAVLRRRAPMRLLVCSASATTRRALARAQLRRGHRLSRGVVQGRPHLRTRLDHADLLLDSYRRKRRIVEAAVSRKASMVSEMQQLVAPPCTCPASGCAPRATT
jgi:hypothetical protein